jgi:hypothetical protein
MHLSGYHNISDENFIFQGLDNTSIMCFFMNLCNTGGNNNAFDYDGFPMKAGIGSTKSLFLYLLSRQ